MRHENQLVSIYGCLIYFAVIVLSVAITIVLVRLVGQSDWIDPEPTLEPIERVGPDPGVIDSLESRITDLERRNVYCHERISYWKEQAIIRVRPE